MTELQNILHHMRNGSVKVNGTTYQLDGDGVTDVDNEADAKKLLFNRSVWRRYAIVKPVTPEPEPEVAEPEVVEEAVEEAPEEVVETSEVVESVAPEPETETEQEDEIDKQYPDPTMDNTVRELRNMADVYQVSYRDQPNKQTLIKRIMDAMYPDED